MAMSDRRLKARTRRRIQVRYGEEKPVRIAFTEDVHREGIFENGTAVTARYAFMS